MTRKAMRPKSRFKTALLFAILILYASRVHADIVYLKNGRSLEGVIIKEDARGVELDMGGGSVGVSKREIREIKRSGAAEKEKMKRGFEQKKVEMEKQETEFFKERERRFSEYSKWQEGERAKSSDSAGETKDIQASKDQRSDGIIVEALINNKVKTVLLVDTGASVVMLSRKIADELGIDLTDTKREITECTVADGRRVKAKTVVLESLSVQGMEEKDVLALVPLEEVPTISLHNGLLGMSYLGRFNIKIDRATMKISLEKIGKK